MRGKGSERQAGEEGTEAKIYERKLRRRRSQNEPQTANKKWTELPNCYFEETTTGEEFRP